MKFFASFDDFGLAEYYNLARNDIDVLKMYVCGDFDPLIDVSLMKYEYYYYTYTK